MINDTDDINGIKNIITQQTYDLLFKSKVDADLKRMLEIEEDLKVNGNCLLMTTYKKPKKKFGQKEVIYRGTQTKCMVIWSQLFGLKEDKQTYSVHELATLDIDDNSYVLGKTIIE